MTDGMEPDEGEEPTDFASEMRATQARLHRVWAADSASESAENESEGVEMAQLDYGREHLAGTLIMCAFENMTTHAIATALLASRGVLRVYRLANAEGGPVVSPAFNTVSALEALEELAQIRGERVEVDGTAICFVPDALTEQHLQRRYNELVAGKRDLLVRTPTPVAARESGPDYDDVCILLARALDVLRRVARGYDWQPAEVDALEAACKDAGVE